MNQNPSDKLSIALFSDPQSLNVYILENLLSSFCYVKIFSREDALWKERTSHLRENNNFSIKSEEDFTSQGFSYFLLDISKLFKNEDLDKTLELIYSSLFSNQSKILIIAPYIVSEEERKITKKVLDYFSTYDQSKTLFVGEIYGPRMKKEDSFVAKLFFDYFSDKKVVFSEKSFYVYPVFAPKLSKRVVSELFSFGTSSDPVVFTSGKIELSDFGELIASGYKGVSSRKNIKSREEQVYGELKQEVLVTDLKKSIKETFEWISAIFVDKPNSVGLSSPKNLPKGEILNPYIPKLVKKTKKGPLFVKLFLFLLTLSSLPVFLTIISAAFLGLAYKEAQMMNFKSSRFLVSVSSFTLILPLKILPTLSQIIMVGPIFKEEEHFTDLVYSASLVGKEALLLEDDYSKLAGFVINKKEYDLKGKSEEIGLALDSLYRNLSFLQAEAQSSSPTKQIFDKIVNSYNFSVLLGRIKSAENLSFKLPILLGGESPKVYLVLLQNNMELRPTGGFIGSFALVSFNKGVLTNFEVHDVYEADGQLKGHVEPPTPIKNYLGEAGWFLRDANWDPDFPTSASKVEWFLDKELNKSVDGVVSVDLNVVSSLLKETGSVNLPDFGKNITADNLYVETQNAVENNFFPGTYQKKNFLTALSQALLGRLIEGGSFNYLGFGKVVMLNLDQKHVQVFLHDSESQENIREMGFSGEDNSKTCSGKNCYADNMGLVDANVGVNKANLSVTRKMALGVNLKDGNIIRNLSVIYTNSGQQAYKNYLRLNLPISSIFIGVSDDGADRQDFDPTIDNGERFVGLLTEVAANSTKTINFSWRDSTNLSLTEPGNYVLNFRKQAGTNADNIIVKISSHKILSQDFSSIKGSFLTNQGLSVYNTTLGKDLTGSFSW